MSDPGNQTPSPSPWIPPSVAELQAMLPRYQVKELWGRGGMGAVYRGWQENLRRAVAIKVLARRTTHGDSDSDADQYARRFKREARSMANLDHPAILSVHDFGETDSGLLYIVMEFIDGMDIHAYLQHYGGKLPERHAVAITAHVLDALQYAHEHGVVHRDIKPSNVLINSEGRVKVADFGLAKELGKASGEGGAAPLTMDGTVMGTLDFIPPEALEAGRQTDGRADLYAVGVMLYQLLTGKLPRGLFKYPAEMMPELDARFDDIIIKALQANPDDRYASATAFRNDLDELLSQPIPLAADPPKWKNPNSPCTWAGGWWRPCWYWPGSSWRANPGRGKKDRLTWPRPGGWRVWPIAWASHRQRSRTRKRINPILPRISPIPKMRDRLHPKK